MTTIDNPICELGVSSYTLTYVGWAKALSGHALARPLPCAQGAVPEEMEILFLLLYMYSNGHYQTALRFTRNCNLFTWNWNLSITMYLFVCMKLLDA